MLYWKKDKIQGIDNLEKRERKGDNLSYGGRFYGNDDRYSHRSWKRLLYMGKRAWKYNWSESSGNAWLGTAGFFAEKYFSRPDVTRRQVKNIVIHYVGNPGTSAKATRNYFDGLADQDAQKEGVSSSSHFVVGLDGEVIQCIPIDEVAYANAPRNDDTLSIEVCHPDDTGKFNDASYESVVKLTAWLMQTVKT